MQIVKLVCDGWEGRIEVAALIFSRPAGLK